MGRRPLLVVAMMILAACSPEPEGASTTVGATSTSTSTTSTTAPAPTTTTTTLPPTTSTTLLEGNWADQPLVIMTDWGGMALGWWDGTSWVEARAGMSLPIDGGEDYQVALIGTEDRRTTGGSQILGCDLLFDDIPAVALADPELVSHPLQPGDQRALEGVAISAPWDLTPHHVAPGEAHPDLEALAVSLLSDREFETDSAPIVQTIDADLDGDGAIETIVVVEDTDLGNEMSGVFSLVFLVGPTLSQPIVVDESVIPIDESGFPASFRVGAVADLNGDGLMEVVLDGLAWENSWISVYELVGGEFVARIGAGCGV